MNASKWASLLLAVALPLSVAGHERSLAADLEDAQALLPYIDTYASHQIVFLSRDGDGAVHIAALTYNGGTDVFARNGEVCQTRELCAVSRYGRFCYVDEAGAVAATARS